MTQYKRKWTTTPMSGTHTFKWYMAEYGKVKRLRRLLLFLVVSTFISIGIWTWFFRRSLEDSALKSRNHMYKTIKRRLACSRNETGNVKKTILIWFVPFHDMTMIPEVLFTGHLPSNLERISWNTSTCGSCRITYDRKMLNRSDAVVFHAFYPNSTNKPPPKSHQDQMYVWWSQESANTLHFDKSIRKYFDWTMTPSSSSNVLSPYGSFPWTLKILWQKEHGHNFMDKMRKTKGIYPADEDDISELERKHFKGKTKLRDSNPTKDAVKQLVKGKQKLAAWIASNCDTGGARIRYFVVNAIEESGLSIDRFGSCNENWLLLSRWDPAFFEFLSKYKFYLSFENSIHCRGYITEKLWYNALYSGAVPVIWGPHRDDVKAVLPPKSYIHIEDFQSTYELVKYLKYLDKNDTAYAEYLQWRKWTKYLNKNGDYVQQNIWENFAQPSQNLRLTLKKYLSPRPIGFCKLCKMLHELPASHCRKSTWPGIEMDERTECLDEDEGYNIAEKVVGKNSRGVESNW
uniref:3-galactosyl-N-acetylglucosaminide 4-alpha-L-fucosyltransferase FUT3-like isoform X1 n=2 Tax=Styela clava TaxID=7725 RepID=UPI00193ACD5F|nr:3-galactosyl-N-acetylglucosaminide 4-alpha-L-fucosyltransferase FUT3-like isoform X1 [Styela clava]XP_039252917.1 3-galactosyl-N-acetylglucosaminide 4-alpha-L-fucosyltransferase FUT3-like isoform X1 [Styela clava]XP_039252918.1 3-galactosyl-N-acetylglucosaminide 4-alpha-L-fucosyltransferase FUT3-like isoform X1 [Styela clava]